MDKMTVPVVVRLTPGEYRFWLHFSRAAGLRMDESIRLALDMYSPLSHIPQGPRLFEILYQHAREHADARMPQNGKA